MEKLNIVSRKLVENELCVYYHFRHFLLLEIKKKSVEILFHYFQHC